MMMLKRDPQSGQGSLETLLLIGGAVLVATVVLLIVLSSVVPGTNDIINTNITDYQHRISLGTGTGGGGASLCGTASEVCASGSSQACTTGGYNGTQSCNATCSGYNPCVATESCGDGTINGPEVCDTLGDVGCSGATPICQSGCGACVAGGGSPPSFNSFIASTGVGSGELSISWDIQNFVAGGANVIKGWPSPQTIPDVATFDATNAPHLANMNASTGSVPFTGLTPNGNYTFYAKSCDTAAPTPNCVLSPVATANASYDAVLFEAEAYDSGSNSEIRQAFAGSYSGGAAITPNPTVGTCSGTADDTYTLTLDPAVAPSTTYYVYARGHVSGGTHSFTLEGVGIDVSILADNWTPATATLGLSGSPTLDIQLQCGDATRLFVDALLVTTDPNCVPQNVAPFGGNCQ